MEDIPTVPIPTTNHIRTIMKKQLLPLLAIWIASSASAQIYFAEEIPISNMSGVTNEGLAVGYLDKRQPFYLWNPQQNTFVEIGGISPGDGVGGTARFDNSGRYLSAPYECDYRRRLDMD